MLINVGDLFQHYRVIERLGEGGMGVVYRAHDTRLGRDVALKFMTHSRVNAELAGRLRREARALAAVNHPNILTIHDIGEAEGVPFLVLEWVDGRALSDPSWHRPFSIREFQQVALPMAEALGAAHDHGIVHRDVKPGNVLVSEEGRVKLADFGLAKFHDPDQDLTRTGAAIGTVAYMSPEQASGGDVGLPSDIFSFGVMAYELLTGQLPFKGESPGAVIGAVLSGRHTPLADLRRDLPAGLVAVVERCLATEPRARFQRGTDVAEALRHALSEDRDRTPERITDTEKRTIAVRPTGEQDIRFCTTTDGVNLAYSAVGAGPVIVRVLGHFTHLEMEWELQDLRRFWEAARRTPYGRAI